MKREEMIRISMERILKEIDESEKKKGQDVKNEGEESKKRHAQEVDEVLDEDEGRDR